MHSVCESVCAYAYARAKVIWRIKQFSAPWSVWEGTSCYPFREGLTVGHHIRGKRTERMNKSVLRWSLSEISDRPSAWPHSSATRAYWVQIHGANSNPAEVEDLSQVDQFYIFRSLLTDVFRSTMFGDWNQSEIVEITKVLQTRMHKYKCGSL